MKIDTSYKGPDYGDIGPANPVSPQKEKVYYPELSLRGEAAEELARAVKAGETFTAEVTFKAVGINIRKGGNSEFREKDSCYIELEIHGLEVPDVAEGDKEDSAEEALDSYLSSKK